MNGESFEDFAGRKGRSLSFSHTRFHRHNSSSEEDDSPSRNGYFQSKNYFKLVKFAFRRI
jgi:hypothetical protein